VIEPVEKQLERAQAFLAAISGAAEKAMASALNRAAAAGRESAIAAIGERYAVRASDVRERVTVTTATAERLGVSVVARSGPLSLTYFPHSPNVAGTGGRGRPVLRAEVVRGQEKDVPGAFIAPINGKPRIMIRTGSRTASGRSAIKSLAAVPIGSMLGASSVRAAVEERAVAVLDRELDREIDKALGRAG
jgi:hypothetical protein